MTVFIVLVTAFIAMLNAVIVRMTGVIVRPTPVSHTMTSVIVSLTAAILKMTAVILRLPAVSRRGFSAYGAPDDSRPRLSFADFPMSAFSDGVVHGVRSEVGAVWPGYGPQLDMNLLKDLGLT
jgi:hypothetical protein